MKKRTLRWDRKGLDWLHALGELVWVRQTALTLAFLGNIPGSLLLWGMMVLAIPNAWVFACLALVGFVVYKTAKKAFSRLRPYESHDHITPRIPPPDAYSFPSGHTCNATLMAFCWSTLGFGGAVIGAVFVVLMGVSRVVLGMHYPSDVVAGFFLGLTLGMWGVLVLRFI